MGERWIHSGRADQWKASIHRRQDANVLRVGQRWRAAMYFLGYAVECRLKAKLMERHGFSHLRQLEDHLSARMGKQVDLFTHSFDVLMNWTEAESRMDSMHRKQWGIVRKWQVQWRYSPRESDAGECSELFNAVEKVLNFITNNV